MPTMGDVFERFICSNCLKTKSSWDKVRIELTRYFGRMTGGTLTMDVCDECYNETVLNDNFTRLRRKKTRRERLIKKMV